MRGNHVAWAILLACLLGRQAVGQVPASVPSGGIPAYPYPAPAPAIQPVGHTAPAPMAAAPMPGNGGFVRGGGNAEDASFWIVGQYLLWTISGSDLPPLLSVSPVGTPLGSAGVLGRAGTTTVFGGNSVNDDYRSGFQVRTGVWLDEDQACGIELSFFMLEGQGSGATAGSPDGSRIVGRPFIDAVTGQANAELVSFPGVLAGSSSVDAGSSNFWGFDGLWVNKLCCGHLGMSGCEDRGYFRVDLLTGYRFLRFDDNVGITEDLTPLGAPFQPGTRILIADNFRARNQFQGATLGLGSEVDWGRWSLWTRARVGLGWTQREVSIQGQTVNLTPGAPAVVNTGGLLALTSNIGEYKSSRFTVLPEGDMTLGYAVCEYCRLMVGYSLIYWPGVARAGEQIDPVVNRNLLPPVGPGPLTGPARPRFSFNSGDLFVHGFTAGMALTF